MRGSSARRLSRDRRDSHVGTRCRAICRCRGPWRSLEAVEFATLEWVDWFNMRRLLEPIGYVPPAEYEARYFMQQAEIVESLAVDPKSAPPGGATSHDRRVGQGLASPPIDQVRGGEREASFTAVAGSPAAPVRPHDQNRSSIAAGVM
jgi:hypothetical protein